MILFDLVYYIFISLSVSYMYSFSDIFLPVRNMIARIPYIRRPLLCPECSSFWFGLCVSFMYNPVVIDITIPYLTNIICGLITHLVACILYKNELLK